MDPPKAGRGHATLVHPEGEMLAVTKFKSKTDTL